MGYICARHDGKQSRTCFFLKSGNSTNNQPNGNGFNAISNVIYCDEKKYWDEQFTAITFSPPHTNTSMVKIWVILSCKVVPVIFRAFSKTKLVPLRPPTLVKDSSSASFSVLQIGLGKKHKS